MKITTGKLMVWAKRAVPVLALAATAGVMMPSCEKEIQQHDEVIWYYCNNNNNPRLRSDTIRKYANDKNVRNIFISVAPNEKFLNYSTQDVSATRYTLSQYVNISPKVRGRGNFEFKPSVCTCGDSLDLVEMGFTINQQNR